MSAQTKRDYYEVLAVERTATDTVIKTSYRKLAMQYHPDRNPGDHHAEEKFKEAAEAYSVLSDAQKRAAYDRFGHQGVNGASGMTLYLFTKDTKDSGKSVCTGGCLDTWPALTVAAGATPTGGTGVTGFVEQATLENGRDRLCGAVLIATSRGPTGW